MRGSETAYRRAVLISALLCALSAGCGTTRSSDSKRTATEQLLISDAVDRTVAELDVSPLGGEEVYLDATYLRGVLDESYLVSTLRQHLLAHGCVLKSRREDARYVVEARAGSVGTDRHDLLYGVPATRLTGIVPVAGLPTSLPEIPFAKKTEQRGVAKVALFAYDRETGGPVWQSGLVRSSSSAKDVWIFGAGPFQKGTIYSGVKFAGDRIRPGLLRRQKGHPAPSRQIELGEAHIFRPDLLTAYRPQGDPAEADRKEAPRARIQAVQVNAEEESAGAARVDRAW